MPHEDWNLSGSSEGEAGRDEVMSFSPGLGSRSEETLDNPNFVLFDLADECGGYIPVDFVVIFIFVRALECCLTAALGFAMLWPPLRLIDCFSSCST